MTEEESPQSAGERIFREESGRIVATLIRVFGDFDLAEEAMQDAFAVALERWPREGIPVNPGAWITTTARRKAIDRLRRDQTLARKQAEIEADAALAALAGERERPMTDVQDDRLRLITGGVDATHTRRPDDTGDRAGLPRSGGDDGPAPGAGEAQDPRRRHPV